MKNLKLERLENFEYWHVRGVDAAATMESLSCGKPDMYKVKGTGSEFGFAVSTGRTEFFLLDEANGSLGAELQKKAQKPSTYLFPRDDALFVLSGEGWKEMMLRVTAFNFKAASDDDFVMANMAGVSAWFRVSESDKNKVVFGCDPSFGHYLYETLCDVVKEVKAL